MIPEIYFAALGLKATYLAGDEKLATASKQKCLSYNVI